MSDNEKASNKKVTNEKEKKLQKFNFYSYLLD